MLNYIIIIIIAYLLGNISTSYIVAKQLSGVDIRTQGSGNAGSTNVLRTLGKKAGALTFIGDVLKGLIAVLIAKMIAHFVNLDETTCAYLAVVAVVLGHNYPVFLGFKGGKGVATSLGSMLGMNPVVALLCLGFFIIIVAITKYVSLGSILVVTAYLIQVIIFGQNGMLQVASSDRIEFYIVSACFTGMALWRHRANIGRLLNGTENKFGMKKK